MKWNEINNTSDIDKLMNTFGYFHDSCLRELHFIAGCHVNSDLSMAFPSETKVSVIFQRQYENPSAIEILFDQIDTLHIIGSQPGYTDFIFGATMIKLGELFYWADQEDWEPEGEKKETATWISARKVKWRDASDWMGATIRYGNDENL